jgi:hypothetical protein
MSTMNRLKLDGFPLCLTDIPEHLHERMVDVLRAKDVGEFVGRAPSQAALWLIDDNIRLLRHLGIYEEALVYAFTRTRTTNHYYRLSWQYSLFKLADRQRLREAGDPLPAPGPYTLYRGVAGRGAARRVRGLSWTGSLECATWFAERAADFGWADPAVFQAVVSDSEVLSYTNDRNEDEYIALLSPQTRVKRYKRLLPDEPETC